MDVVASQDRAQLLSREYVTYSFEHDARYQTKPKLLNATVSSQKAERNLSDRSSIEASHRHASTLFNNKDWSQLQKKYRAKRLALPIFKVYNVNKGAEPKWKDVYTKAKALTIYYDLELNTDKN
ncbi:hypothetical protein K501DRAFT_268305 [Backusella circina FSU 941]|nr:hypothetical protein K501DRAFT_268305 [Backusella circina FSU 941]